MQVEINEFVGSLIISGESVILIHRDSVRKVYKSRNWVSNLKKDGYKGEIYFLKKYKSPMFVELIDEKDHRLEKLGEASGSCFKFTKTDGMKDWLKKLSKELDRLEIAHGDINPVNILESGDSYKLVDFTTTREKSDERYKKAKEKDKKDIEKWLNSL